MRQTVILEFSDISEAEKFLKSNEILEEIKKKAQTKVVDDQVEDRDRLSRRRLFHEIGLIDDPNSLK